MTYSRVMCLVRGDEADEEVIRTAVSQLTGNQRSIRFVYVIVVDRRQAIDDPDPQVHRNAERVLRNAEQAAGVRGESRGVILQSRSIAPVLIREALDYGAEAIVAGVRVLTSFGSKMIDPDSEYLLANAPCAVVLHRTSVLGFDTEDDRSNSRAPHGVAHLI